MDPVRDRLECGSPREVVGNDGSMGASVVALGDGAEALLACCVPHLHLQDGRDNRKNSDTDLPSFKSPYR